MVADETTCSQNQADFVIYFKGIFLLSGNVVLKWQIFIEATNIDY